jgi:hypothetical protein
VLRPNARSLKSSLNTTILIRGVKLNCAGLPDSPRRGLL